MYLAVLVVVSLLSLGAQIAAGPSGHWEGKIQIPEHELGITVDLEKSSAGIWIGSMSILVSTSIDVPLVNIIVDGTVVRFTATLPGKTSFDGKLSVDAKGLSGTASSIEGRAPFQLTRNGEANVKVPPPSSALSKEFEGAWEGTLDVGGKTKRIGLKLSAADDGTAIGVLTSADPGVTEIPVTVVTLKGTQLQLESRAVSGTYTGTLGSGGEIVGEWAQRSLRLPLILRRTAPLGK